MNNHENMPENIAQKSLVALFGNMFALLIIAYFAWIDDVWQMYALAVCAGIGLVISIVGWWLIRKGNEQLGAWLIVGVGMFIVLAAGLLIANIGLFLAIIVISVTVLSAPQLLPLRQANWAIAASFGIGITVALLDQLNLEYRWPFLEQIPIVAVVFIGLILLGYAIFVIRDFVNYSLRTKMLITLVTIVIVAVSAVAFLTIITTRQTLIDDVNDKLLAGAIQTAASIDTFIQTNLDAVKAEAQLPDLVLFLSQPTEDVKPSTTLISLNGKNAEFISSYALLNLEGTNVADSVGLNIGSSEVGWGYFTGPLETGQPYVSPVLFNPDENEGVLYFSAPVRNAVGQIIGVLRVVYKAAVLQRLVEENTAGEHSFAVLFDENHLHLAHSEGQIAPTTNYKLVDMPAPATLAQLNLAGRVPNAPEAQLSTLLPELEQNLTNLNPQAPYFEAVDKTVEGEELNQAAVAVLKTQPWLLAFFQPQNVLFEPIQVQTRNIILLTGLITIVVAAVALFVSQQLSKPIVRLRNMVGQVAEGNLKVQAPVETQDEIGQLSEAFNTMTSQLRSLVGSLEEQVAARTKELAQSMEVGQRAAAIRDIDELLPTIAKFIREQFNLYYVHVYFIDDIGQNLVIKSGTGTVGEQLMARRHSLPLGATAIVSRAATTAKAVVVPDTELSDIHQPNPLLPDTRSELAVPLIVEGEVIGVLDMQSDQTNAFTLDNVTVFEAMATQLAISMDSAQQWTLAQEAQQKLQNAVQQLTREVWAERLGSKQARLGFAYDLFDIKPVQFEMAESGTSVPVVVQNQQIGQLSVVMPEDRHLSTDEKLFLDAVTQQLAQKTENLRLFEETQQQATREQLSRQIADKIRASRDIETALNTAARELSKALGVSRAMIDLNVTDTNESTQPLTNSSKK